MTIYSPTRIVLPSITRRATYAASCIIRMVDGHKVVRVVREPLSEVQLENHPQTVATSSITSLVNHIVERVRDRLRIPAVFEGAGTARCASGEDHGTREEWYMSLLTNTHAIVKYFRLFAYSLFIANRRPRRSRHHLAKVVPILRHQ